MNPVLHHSPEADIYLVSATSQEPEVKINRHGHIVYEPSHKSIFKKKTGISRRVALQILRAGSLETVKKIIKDRKKLERIAKRKKHDKALAGRGAKSSAKATGKKRPTGKEKK